MFNISNESLFCHSDDKLTFLICVYCVKAKYMYAKKNPAYLQSHSQRVNLGSHRSKDIFNGINEDKGVSLRENMLKRCVPP